MLEFNKCSFGTVVICDILTYKQIAIFIHVLQIPANKVWGVLHRNHYFTSQHLEFRAFNLHVNSGN